MNFSFCPVILVTNPVIEFNVAFCQPLPFLTEGEVRQFWIIASKSEVPDSIDNFGMDTVRISSQFGSPFFCECSRKNVLYSDIAQINFFLMSVVLLESDKNMFGRFSSILRLIEQSVSKLSVCRTATAT